ncbi:hypothetical protein [Acinetobacter sp. UBA5984]|uniref:hypothetical protein n=1 Tax=Acinetobacter sp. UBA5984 TaxID=1945948 RepID=UPI002579AF28|nr:hypothetical protein [Acinetobacter sp. UBA5984]
MSKLKYQLSTVDKRSFISDLKAEYLYICVPFIVLILVKVYFGPLRDIIYSSDWSLAASIILGQNAAKISRSISKMKQRVNDSSFSWYSSKRFLLVIVSLFFYFGMIFKPNIYIAFSQIFMFLLASWLHFSDGFTLKMLERETKKMKDA